MLAAAVLVALVAAMFVALAPARAHDLGSCVDPEYLTQAKCRAEVKVDHDSDASTPAQLWADGDDNDPWTAADHTRANHPPTLTLSFNDSDGIVAAGTPVTVTVTASGILATSPDTDDDGSLSAAEIEAANGTDNAGSDAGAIALSWIRVSGELDHPAVDAAAAAGAKGSLSLAATDSTTDDASTSSTSFDIIVPAGTTPGKYTVSALITGAFDYGAKAVTNKVATKVLTVGEAGTGLSSATLSLGNRVPDDKATVSDESRPESGSDVADGDGINLVVTATNSLGNKSNDSDVTQITVIAPGGDITITGALDLTTTGAEELTDRYTASGTNSASLGGAAATDAVKVGQTISLNVEKAGEKPGSVDVYVILTGKGAAISETLTLSFTGDASSLTLGGASGSLHSQFVSNAVAATTNTQAVADSDHRDTISFALSATDAGGNNAGVPKVKIDVFDPSGKRVGTTDLDRDQVANAAGVPNAKITLSTMKMAPAALKAGEYKVKVTAGENSAEQTFTVAGAAATIAATAESNTDPVQLGSLITVTAAVTDKDGAAVADGTLVTFTTAGALELNSVGKTADVKTKAGSAKAQFVASKGSGLASIIVTSGDASGTASVSLAGTAAMEDTDPSLSDLSGTSGLVSYSGPDTTASELLALLAGRANAIWLSNNGGWVLYANVGGAMVPGSENFTVTSGDVLYISN